jgi:hypothetical protein
MTHMRTLSLGHDSQTFRQSPPNSSLSSPVKKQPHPPHCAKHQTPINKSNLRPQPRRIGVKQIRKRKANKPVPEPVTSRRHTHKLPSIPARRQLATQNPHARAPSDIEEEHKEECHCHDTLVHSERFVRRGAATGHDERGTGHEEPGDEEDGASAEVLD